MSPVRTVTPRLRFVGSVCTLCAIPLVAAPAAASEAALISRTMQILGRVCSDGVSSNTLQVSACAISGQSGALPASEEAAGALQFSPDEAAAAGTNASQTTSAHMESEQERLAEARVEAAADAGRSARFGGFLNGFGAFGDVDRQGEEEGFDISGGGVVLGMDYRLTDSLVAGAAFGWSRTDSDFDSRGGGDLETDGYSASLYGSWFQGPLFVDLIGTYSYVDYEQKRVVAYGAGTPAAFSGIAHSDTDANQVGLNGGAGYQFDLNGLALTPSAQLGWIHTDIDGYRETGSVGPLALRQDDQHIDSLVLSLGGDVSYPISTGFGVIIPQVGASWEHEFADDPRNIDALIIADDSGNASKIRVRTDSPDRDYARLGAGVSAQLRSGISAFVDYQTLLGLSDVQYHKFTAGARIEF